MIGAGISYYGNTAPAYLLGNAKVYDGSFDYDDGALWAQLDRTTAHSFNINLLITTISGGREIFMQGNITGGRYSIRIAGGVLNILMQRTAAINELQFTTTITAGYNSIIITYAGNGNVGGFNVYVNGITMSKTTIANTLTSSIISATTSFRIGARNNTPITFILGRIRQLEIINRVASPTEIALASITGSFQGAGTVSNAEYLLAVDFDKTGTANLTTRASTPTYTITAQGGAAYTQYLP